ncbi:unnamed protein product [Rotaria socialis]|uniref:Uncharacterized protein n=1 Tax=Rotaria socialis TaxID=392032 RepID=A0A818CS40_9BILA|nr:unnamed protein product [Rotaria socialis]CAF3750336.1 unnamed protein product [Rotaria socialis]CAF4625363.1 unnamed protein product [Rotaria socialis]CAF4717511.1 unnamed protein product [Rotaria socialis]
MDAGSWYCGRLKINLNRIGIYILLILCAWCAAIAFFEGTILAYAPASDGDTCPVPQKVAITSTMDCFIFANPWDSNPINMSYLIKCNESMVLKIGDFGARCFGWIYNDVKVVDVLEELGSCAGII